MWKKKYFEAFFSDNHDETMEAYNIKEKNFPASLYKYKKLDEHSLTLLKNDLMYLSDPIKLNDPYEGDILFNAEIIQESFLEMIMGEFMKNISNSNLGITEEEKDNLLNSDNLFNDITCLIHRNDSNINKIPLEEWQKSLKKMTGYRFHNIIQKIDSSNKNNTCLACFSESNRINPMWAFYSENHQGICIEYDFKESNKGILIGSCYPIYYVEHNDSTEEICKMRNKNINILKLVHDPFLKKSIDWSYEKEWRLKVEPKEPNLRFFIKIDSNYFIKMPKPKAIFLGLKSNENNKYEKKIKKICEDREISLFKMVKDISGYNLHPKKLLEFPTGKPDDVDYISKCIKRGTYKNLIHSHFFNSLSLKSTINSSNLIFESFKTIYSQDKIISFLDKLLFKNEFNPVLSDYYNNILIFLIEIYKHKDYSNLTTSDGMSIKDNLIEWINLSFSEFHKKPVIMYLIRFERLLRCFYSRYIILNDKDRKNFENKLSNFYEIQGNIFPKDYAEYCLAHKISNKKFFREANNKDFPSFSNDLAEIIDNNILNNLNIILSNYYIDGYFLESDCNIEFMKLKKIVAELEELTEEVFNEKNGENLLWLAGDIEQILNSNSNFSIDRTYRILDNYNDILQELMDEINVN